MGHSNITWAYWIQKETTQDKTTIRFEEKDGPFQSHSVCLLLDNTHTDSFLIVAHQDSGVVRRSSRESVVIAVLIVSKSKRSGKMHSNGRGLINKGSATVSGSRILTLFLSMFGTFASVYVAGRLWQDSQNRVYMIKELDRLTGQGQSAISVDDTLKIIACREKEKKLAALHMELATAKQEGFNSKLLIEKNVQSKKRHLLVIGIMTKSGHKNKRDAIRKAWMGIGSTLKKMEDEKGIVARFVIGQSANLEREIDVENRQTNDFIVLDNHVEEIPEKARLFFAFAAEKWDAEFYAKVNDNVYVNIDALGSTLASHKDKPRVYIGCMKSGEVFSDRNHKWYEPEWWKFGDKKSYFRHASGDIYVISQALAKYILINRSILRTYAHDDVSAGSWFIGLDVKHVDEGKFCCSSWSSGAICAGV